MEILKEKIQFQKYPAYKDSGVEWLGEIPENWEILPLYAVAKIRSEKNFPDLQLLSVYLDLGVIRFDDVEEKRTNVTSLDLSNYQKIYEGDFVLNNQQAWRGSVGVSIYEGIISPAYIVLKLSSKLNPHFANFLFRNSATVAQYLVSSKGVGTIQRNLYWPQLRRTSISIPPLKEQTAIAGFLDEKCGKSNAAIEQKQKLIELLKERKQIIIQNAVTKGLYPDVEMEDSEINSIGKIPAHWQVKKLKYILESQGRIGFKGYTTSDLVGENEGALVLGASHMDWDGNLKLNSPVFISWAKYFESPEIMVSKGDILIVQRGSTCGKVALVNEDLGPTTINPSLVLLKNNIEYSQYVYQAIKVVLNEILNLVSNTAIPMLSQFQIDNILVPVPPATEQQEIVDHIIHAANQIDKAIKLQLQQIEKLKEYKSSLIDAAVTGKIKVS